MSATGRVIRVIATVLVTLLVIAALVGVGYAVGRTHAPGSIEVSGSASASGVPDTVAFTIGVSTTNASTAAALAANNTRTRAVESALLAAGEPRTGLATSGLNVSSVTNAQGQVTGYQVYDELTVTSHHVARAGRLIGAALGAAGNTAQLSGITYSITNRSAVMARARAKAMANAKHAAAQLAGAASATLGAVTHIVDNEVSQPFIEPGFYAATAAKAAALPVQPGNQSVSVTVRVTYALG